MKTFTESSDHDEGDGITFIIKARHACNFRLSRNAIYLTSETFYTSS